jgi:hypothetical protein
MSTASGAATALGTAANNNTFLQNLRSEANPIESRWTMEKIAALENLKKEWEAYQTFCLDFVRTFEEKHPGYGPNKDCWTTTELKNFADTDFEPQIHRLETSVNAAYDITARLKIAGYSRDEMAQLIYKIAERPHGFSAEKQQLIHGIISGLDAVIKAAIKPARAEIEALIKSLLAWQNEQPEFTTGLEPDEDRILNPVDKLRLARFADKAKVFLQDSPSHKNVLQSFVTALSTNNIPATLMTGTKLLDVLCEVRHTLPKTDGNAGDGKPAETERNGTPAKEKNQASVINIQNSNVNVIQGNTGNPKIEASVSMNNQPQIEKKGMVKKIIELIFKEILDHIIAIIATFTITALIGILRYFGWIEQIKAFIYNVLSQATK